ncbi:sulfotransferase 6B1-like [Rhineura floridana]|uniref:sulfotransferase 6B1-like n=1 Tax=Rhineura floridana TaxID=261503 RepID=UPI002AC820E1|nr:sulfotransferase 6B1-like [Rhineura floridana]
MLCTIMAQKGLREFLDKKMEEADKIAPQDRLFLHDGGLYPILVCQPETLKMLDTFEARSDDVILVGYPKTGTNWVGQILVELASASGKYDEEERKQRQQKENELSIRPYLEFGDPGKFERMKTLPSRRIIKTHLIPQKIPKSIFQKKAKMLALFRNPKDTAVSYFHFAKGMKLVPDDQQTWEEFFPDFMSGKVPYCLYFDYIIEWNKYMDDKNIMFITYEELKENETLGLKKIAEFFGFSVTEQDIQSIVGKTSFKAMKEKSLETHGKMGESLFRKGIIGDWRNVFSESQNEEMDRKFEETVASTKLGVMLKYELYCKS